MEDRLYTTPAKPGQKPEDFIEGPTMRRLCICTFECPLCHKNHESEIYITAHAHDLDEFHAELQMLRKDWQAIKPALTSTAMLIHQEHGDLAKLMKRAVKEGSTTTDRVPTIELTSESAYTCDDCSRTSATMEELRSHMAVCR